MAAATNFIGIWSTTIPGAYLAPTLPAAASGGDLVINADGTYIWYTSYAKDGIAKTGIWSASQGPDYPLVLQDNDESFYWKVGFKSDVSSIWLVPITFSGNPTYFWYYGTLIQSLPGATTPTSSTPIASSPQAPAVIGLEYVQSLTEPQPDQDIYILTFDRNLDYLPLQSLAIGESAALIIEANFTGPGDTDTFKLDLSALLPADLNLFGQDFILAVAATNGASVSSLSGNTRAVLPYNSTYSQAGFRGYFLNTGPLTSNQTFQVTNQTGFSGSYTFALAIYRFAGTATSISDLGKWRQLGLDPSSFVPIRTVGQVILGLTPDGYAVKIGAILHLITYNGRSISGIAGWSVIVAVESNGGFSLYWKNSLTGQFASWLVNSQGQYISSIALSPEEWIQSELVLGIDLDGDGQASGLTFNALNSVGGIQFGTTQLGYSLIPAGSNTPIALRYAGSYLSAGSIGLGWEILTARSIAGGYYHIYWHNTLTDAFALWGMNSSGDFIGGVVLSLETVLGIEVEIGFDLDGDGLALGLRFNALNSVGGIQFGTTQLGYSLIPAGSNTPIALRYAGSYLSAGSIGLGWEILTARSIAGGYYHIYWHNTLTDAFALWGMNSSGDFIGGVVLSLETVLGIEVEIGFDLDGDGLAAGLVFTPLHQSGAISFGTTQRGYAIQTGSGANLNILTVTLNGSDVSAVSIGQGWQAIHAFDEPDTGYSLYWHNNTTGNFVVWELGGQGNYLQHRNISQRESLFEELRVNFDLNNDGRTGFLNVQQGSNNADSLTGAAQTVTFGLNGSDQLTAATAQQDGWDVLIGGTGSDIYNVGSGGRCIIMDQGLASDSNSLSIQMGAGSTPQYFTLDNGRHLILSDDTNGTYVLLANWQDPSNKFSSIQINDFIVDQAVILNDPNTFDWTSWGLTGISSSLIGLPDMTTTEFNQLLAVYGGISNSLST
jgi:hypothetical protein